MFLLFASYLNPEIIENMLLKLMNLIIQSADVNNFDHDGNMLHSGQATKFWDAGVEPAEPMDQSGGSPFIIWFQLFATCCFFIVRSVAPSPTQLPSLRNTPRHLSATAHSIYLQLHSISGGFQLHQHLEAVSQTHYVFVWLLLWFNLTLFLLCYYLADLHGDEALRNMSQNSCSLRVTLHT